MTTVVHLRYSRYNILIDRRTIWGNPYTVGKDGTREMVIKKHKLYVLNSPELLARLSELKDKILG